MSSYFTTTKDLILGVNILVEDVLERYQMDETDRRIVISALRDVCFQMASAHASSKALEETLKGKGIDLLELIRPLQPYMDNHARAMMENYPRFWRAEKEAFMGEHDLDMLRDWYCNDPEDEYPWDDEDEDEAEAGDQ